MLAGGSKALRFGALVKAVGLITISLLCIAFLFYVFLNGAKLPVARLDARSLLVIGILTGVLVLALAAAIMFLQAAGRAKRVQSKALDEVRILRRSLQAAQAILQAEPQVLIFWEANGEPRVVTNTLSDALGVPRDGASLLRFRSWIEPDSAGQLEEELSQLFKVGQAFNVMIKTIRSAHLEADGRTSGGRMIVKFRDLAGQREDLAEIIDRQRQLDRDIAARRALLDAVPMPVWFRGSDSKIEWVNRAYVAAVEADSVKGVTEQQVELLEARQREEVAATLVAGNSYRKRLHTIVGGERRAFDTIVLPLDKASAGIAVDVAALESAEGELDRLIEAHSRTLDHVSTAIASFGPDQSLSFYNQAYLDLWGLEGKWLESAPKHGEILDKLRGMRKLPEQADYRSWKKEQLQSYQAGEPKEDWWHLPDGRSLKMIAEPHPDGGIIHLYDDLTERLDLESRYNALFHVQRETLENLAEGVAVFATDGRLTLFNPAFAAIWKLSAKKLEQGPHIDQVIAECRVLHDDDRIWTAIKRSVTAIYETRQPISDQLNRSDGSVIDYASQPLPDGASLLTFVDNTDTKRAERMLIERNDALEAADRLKNDFIKNVSYELRTPLTNIIGFSELLASPAIGQLNKKQIEYLDDIRASSGTLLAIINDILDLATIDAGALDLKLSKVDVVDVIRAAALGVRQRLTRAKLSLDIHVDQNVGTFIADEKRVTQVLYNLLSNAIGFSDENRRIALLCRNEDNMVAFTVVDQGCGIPEDYRGSVFKRFETRSQGSKHRGAGLGLSLVESIVELHKGDVTLRSKPGTGTVVTVRFPREGHQIDGQPTLEHPDQDHRKLVPPGEIAEDKAVNA